MIELKDLQNKPKPKERIQVMIDPSINEKLTKYAIDNDLSKSNVIWLALANYFEQVQK